MEAEQTADWVKFRASLALASTSAGPVRPAEARVRPAPKPRLVTHLDLPDRAAPRRMLDDSFNTHSVGERRGRRFRRSNGYLGGSQPTDGDTREGTIGWEYVPPNLVHRWMSPLAHRGPPRQSPQRHRPCRIQDSGRRGLRGPPTRALESNNPVLTGPWQFTRSQLFGRAGRPCRVERAT
jgi:hypothetical protein